MDGESMNIKLTEKLVNAIGMSFFKTFYINEDNFRWQKFIEINLRKFTLAEAKELLEECKKYMEIRGTSVVVKDIETWISACERPGTQKVRKLEHFCDLLGEYILQVPGHRIFQKHDKDGNAWLCYYVESIEYHPARQGNYGDKPAYVEMTTMYDKFGSRKKNSSSFYDSDVRGRKIEEILANDGYYIETEEMRKKYLEEVRKYTEIIPQIGQQYTVCGIGTSDAPKSKDEDRYSYHSNSMIFVFENNVDKTNRVVIDTFTEDGSDPEREHQNINTWYWHDKQEQYERRKKAEKTEKETADDKEVLKAEDLEEETPEIEIPTHTFAVVFDLKRHVRLSAHVNYLTKYVYDKSLDSKLVLPKNIKHLIAMLVEHKSGNFKDIVAGKSGGAIVLLTGPPGVGKTLTAEVFAEAEEKPLYSIQASQLGTDPDALEKNLMKSLGRASRWDAIMLIDEADVYVHERGNDLQQNAIVGVFLRVLEYHASVLFLTTNRPDLVDDAIASRCVARIDYPYPSKEEQEQIWKVLLELQNVTVTDEVIKQFVETHSSTSGRDIKNILKLARLVSKEKHKAIELQTLEYVRQFNPTVFREQKEKKTEVN
ncbi:MAG: ATP-binding protein [Proteobacteria bacterium]|nr:ATP-binding protein [Pseudomonadota bacterium]